MLSQLIDKGPALIPLRAVRTDGGTQMRAALDQATIAEYAAAMQDAGGWGSFPPVVLYYDGTTYWLADGFHRLEAFTVRTIANRWDGLVPADVRAGDRRAAILHAAQANAAHGLRRTEADKRRAVAALLADDEWRSWSDREIARRCAVSPTFVGKVRASLSIVDSEATDARTYTTKHGTTATMHTAAIGATPRPATPAPDDRRFVAAEPPAPAPQPVPQAHTPSNVARANSFFSIAAGYVDQALRILPRTSDAHARAEWVRAELTDLLQLTQETA